MLHVVPTDDSPIVHVHDAGATLEQAQLCKSDRVQLKNAHAQERRSLLTIIGVLAHGYFPGSVHGQPHTMATELREEMTKLALTLSQVTVANKLREAMELVAVSAAITANTLALVPSPPAERKDYLQRLIDAVESTA